MGSILQQQQLDKERKIKPFSFRIERRCDSISCSRQEMRIMEGNVQTIRLMSPTQTTGTWRRDETAHFEWSLCDEKGSEPLSRTCRTFSTLRKKKTKSTHHQQGIVKNGQLRKSAVETVGRQRFALTVCPALDVQLCAQGSRHPVPVQICQDQMLMSRRAVCSTDVIIRIITNGTLTFHSRTSVPISDWSDR